MGSPCTKAWGGHGLVSGLKLDTVGTFESQKQLELIV